MGQNSEDLIKNIITDANYIKLFNERHLDQLIVCSIFASAKYLNNEHNSTFLDKIKERYLYL